MTAEAKVGKTKDAGWQVGARKTFDIGYRQAWEFMLSENGLQIWLGEGLEKLETGNEDTAADGTEIRVTVLKPFSHIRMTWREKEAEGTSRLQMRVIESNEKTVIAFHQEMLKNAEQRAEMKRHWKSILERLEMSLADLT